LASGSRQAEQLLQKLVEQKKPEGLESAIQHRNRLLEYDRTRQVIKHELTLREPVKFYASLRGMNHQFHLNIPVLYGFSIYRLTVKWVLWHTLKLQMEEIASRLKIDLISSHR
jgi:hypothetical protein